MALLHLAPRVLDLDHSGALVARGVPGGLGRRGLEDVVVDGIGWAGVLGLRRRAACRRRALGESSPALQAA